MSQYRSRTRKGITMALIAVFGSMPGFAAFSASECQKFTLTSDVTLSLFPVPSGIAVAELVLEDGTVFPIIGEGIVTDIRISDEGLIHMNIEELDSWGDLGTSIGLDRIKLTPTDVPGVYTVKVRTALIGKSGDVEDVLGKYHGNGTVSFRTFTLTHTGKGRICHLP